MGLFNKTNGGLMDQIRCDESSYLIWKWHPKGSELNNNTRENAIRWGSSLRVKDGEVAVFVYNQGEDKKQDFIVGPFDEIIKTKNFPVLASIVGLAYDGGTPFQAEIYFINLAKIIQINFAVPYFDVYDYRFDDFGVPLAVRGTLSFKIEDYKEFVKLHRLNTFNLEDFQNQVKDAISKYAKNVVSNITRENKIPLVQIETKISEISNEVEKSITERLKANFGVLVSGIDIGTIELDKTSDGYKQLMSVTKDVTSATIEAEKEAKVKNITDKQRIDIHNYEEQLRIQREEGQYAQHKQTQSSNIGAFQVEKNAEVGIAGANALGKMGENGAGSINLGNESSGGTGFNPAVMMASMAVGGAVGQNIANTMNNALSNMNQNNNVEPPIPQSLYKVVINGEAKGPFDENILKQMVDSNQINKDTLAWKKGMEDWKKISDIENLKTIFDDDMPPIPKQD